MDELEQEVIDVVHQYAFALRMAPPVRAVLVKIATRNEWHNLLRELKK